MDLYAGNSTLYRFIKRYRQPVFLDRNLSYLFHTRLSSGQPTSGTASDSGGQGLSSHASPSRKRKRSRRRVTIEDVCGRLLANSVAEFATAAIAEPKLSSFVVQPILKIEATGIVKLARSLRSHIGRTKVQLRNTSCSCEIMVYRMQVSPSGKRRAKKLVFQSSEICTLIPAQSSPWLSNSAQSPSASPPPREKSTILTLVMNEPFYIKASTLTDTLTASEEYVYTVTLSLRSTSSHCEKSWPFTMEAMSTSWQTVDGLNELRQHTASPRNSNLSSPSRSPARQSPLNRKSASWSEETARQQSPSRRSNVAASAVASIRRRLGMSVRGSPVQPPSRSDDGDADDEHDADVETSDGMHDPKIELRAEWEFTLLSCPEPGYVVQLQFYKNGRSEEVKSGSEICVEIDMGWSVPSTKDYVKRKEKFRPDGKPAEKINGESEMESSTGEVRERSTARLSTPNSDRELRGDGIVEVRYHFATAVNTFKTYILSGFGCPWCYDKDFHTCEPLHFHFTTCHELFSFRMDQRQPQMIDVYITLTGEFLYERASTKVPDMRIVQWMRPKSKFRLLDYLRGDLSWLQEGAAALAMQMPMNPATSAVLESRTRSHARQSSIRNVTPGLEESLRLTMVSVTQGFDVDTVPELPPKARRIFPVPEIGVELYTTKSKRLLRPGEEMSESEDENDDSWLAHKHEETIDDFEDVTASEKKFMKAWDRHIFEERPSSYKHVRDSLARFCRKNREMLSDRLFLIEFWKHCLNLIDCGIIEPACFYSCMQWLKHVAAENEFFKTIRYSEYESAEEMEDVEERSGHTEEDAYRYERDEMEETGDENENGYEHEMGDESEMEEHEESDEEEDPDSEVEGEEDDVNMEEMEDEYEDEDEDEDDQGEDYEEEDEEDGEEENEEEVEEEADDDDDE
ncbi:uncharacterized protein V1513DRAFT_485556 [Lipomyces chichibuensis]|uniref:uncharacterized protein n=1 Tax=Lipomyces chichibuensis TaxID=1546026 RepID=UPI00334391D6